MDISIISIPGQTWLNESIYARPNWFVHWIERHTRHKHRFSCLGETERVVWPLLVLASGDGTMHMCIIGHWFDPDQPTPFSACQHTRAFSKRAATFVAYSSLAPPFFSPSLKSTLDYSTKRSREIVFTVRIFPVIFFHFSLEHFDQLNFNILFLI